MRNKLLILPRWARYLVAAAVAADVVVSVVVALLPDHHPIWGAFGGPVGVLAVRAYQNRDFDRLSRSDRFKVLATRRTGTSSGDGRLDAIARRQLHRAARSYRSDRILLPIVTALTLACPVIAAIRRDDARWLLLLLPMALLLSPYPFPDPRPPLAALESTGAG